MAEIKRYEDGKKKRTEKENQLERSEREYKRHKRLRFIRIMSLPILLGALALGFIIYYNKKDFIGYDTVNTAEREMIDGAQNVKLGNSVLTYSKDGAHCVDMKGVTTWNQSFEIQDIKLATCRDMSAICGYNGHQIYVQSASQQLGEIQTNLPIKDITVAATGRVTAVLEDSNAMWINTYEPDGKAVYEGQFHMVQSGYPCAVSISPSGNFLAVSFLFLDEGNISSYVAFYNYGPVGDNQSDQLVGSQIYHDMVIPEIHFMDDSSAFAVGDNRLMFFKCEQKAESRAEYILDKEIKAVYYSPKYVGLVFASDKTDAKYMLQIYNATGEQVAVKYFDMEYLGIFFEDKTYAMYNGSECAIYDMSGASRYEGRFDKNVTLMLPTETPYRYRIVTDTSIDTIQLK